MRVDPLECLTYPTPLMLIYEILAISDFQSFYSNKTRGQSKKLNDFHVVVVGGFGEECVASALLLGISCIFHDLRCEDGETSEGHI